MWRDVYKTKMDNNVSKNHITIHFHWTVSEASGLGKEIKTTATLYKKIEAEVFLKWRMLLFFFLFFDQNDVIT